MNPIYDIEAGHEPERYELFEQPRYQFRHTRRTFIQIVSTGILITWTAKPGYAQRVESGEEAPHGSRFHIGKDGRITATTGKVEMGQGARTQITQAVAEEFHVPVDQVQLVMADTDLVPNDGPSHGSRTTPSTIPRVRGAAAAAREALIQLACKRWGVDANGASIEKGIITHTSGKKTTLAELAASGEGIEGIFATESSASDRSSTEDWTVLGTPALRPNARDIASGTHRYPSDIKRPGMLYGKILRPPAVGAKLISVDIGPAKALEGVSAVHDGDFVGCAAPTRLQAAKALEIIAKTAKWSDAPASSSETLFTALKEKSQAGSGRGRSRDRIEGDVDAALAAAKNVLRASYEIPYIQHAPMEPRAAVAEWEGRRLTLWTGTQQPFGVRGDVARAFALREDQVRVITPDFGGGFGGKQDAEVAIEAARLAKEAGKPVAVHWTREEEFSWAYCRPAGLVEVAAGIADDGSVSAWEFTNYNSGGSGIDCPYTIPNLRIQFRPSESPLRQGSYRALASTANNFARETFIDQLVAETKAEPLAFRLAHLTEDRMKGVLTAAAERFGWINREKAQTPNVGFGIACGTEKGSFVATCAEIELQLENKRYAIRRICVAFECGAIQNPKGLQNQVEGCVIMGLGAVLREKIEFENGRVANTNFKKYEVPRFKDVPPIDVVLVNRPDLPSAGAGETPIIAIAPAVANAIANAGGPRTSRLPIQLA